VSKGSTTTSTEDRLPGALLATTIGLTALAFAVGFTGRRASGLGEIERLVHGLLEWGDVSVALFTAALGLLYLKVRQDSLVWVVTLASIASFVWDGMHAVSSVNEVTVTSRAAAFVPWTWAAARTMEALVLGAGAAVLVFSKRVPFRLGSWPLLGAGAFFALAAYLFWVVSIGASLPPAQHPGAILTRPWDLPALVMVLFNGLVIYPLLVRRRPSVLSKTLLLAALPETVSSIQMVFGPAVLYDRELITPHALTLASSLLPMSGLCLYWLRSYRQEVTGAQSMERLIADLKRAEDGLRSKEIQLNQLTSSIKEVFWISSADGKSMHYVSAAYEEIFGLPCEALYRDPGAFLEVVHPDDKAMMTRHLVEVPDEKFEVDYRILRHDGGKGEGAHEGEQGEIRWLRTRGFPIRDDAGEIYRVAGLTEDVTERKHSEEELRRSEARHRALLRAMPDIMFRMSRSGVFLDYCAQRNTPLYRPPSVFLGARVQDVMPGIGDIFVNRIQETLATGVVQSYEYPLDCRGRTGYFEARFAPSSDDEVLVVVRDVTEQMQLEKELLDVSNRERERIGHDLHDGLSQQLTGIALLCKVLQQQLDDREIPEAERARQIVALVEDALSQTKSLARGLAPVELDAGGLTAALQDFAHGVEALHRVRCHFRCDRNVTVADRGEAVHLYRIAQEAVSNALKHGKPSRIAIELTSSIGRLRLAIEDDGTGIRDDSGNHHGMGLHIMRYRARMIDGTLEVRRLAKGGTLVACEWPDVRSGDRSLTPETAQRGGH
jgi:PAS domain S-box-containing protein